MADQTMIDQAITNGVAKAQEFADENAKKQVATYARAAGGQQNEMNIEAVRQIIEQYRPALQARGMTPETIDRFFKVIGEQNAKPK